MGFNEWWHETGSGIRPAQGTDMEAHARFVANVAWNEATRGQSSATTGYTAPHADWASRVEDIRRELIRQPGYAVDEWSPPIQNLATLAKLIKKAV